MQFDYVNITSLIAHIFNDWVCNQVLMYTIE